ncbi:MAG: hypothetical protein P9M14_03040 [Candidatus Alcyoniella australis]|nr:hypothetical protein [Candidatus Alcyoniella australis]
MSFSRVIIIVLSMLLLAGCPNGSEQEETASTTPSTTSPTPAPATANDGIIDVELWAMSQCPFGTNAILLMDPVKDALGDRVNVKVRFVIGEKEGQLRSLHGPKELDLNRSWICVDEIDMKKAWPMVVSMIEDKSLTWEAAAGQQGIDLDALRQCIEGGRADELLRADLALSQERNVNYSPALFVDGSKYSGKISSMDLFQRACAQLQDDNKPKVCSDPPMELSYNDGPQGNMRCGGDEEQPLADAETMEIEMTVISYDAALTSPAEHVLESTRKLFPNLKINEIRSDTPEGERLIQSYGIVYLPAFMFEKKVEQTKPFEMLTQEDVLEKKQDHYLLKAERVGANVNIDRPAVPGRVVIYYMPYSQRVPLVLLDTIDLIQRMNVEMGDNFVFSPYALLDENGQPVSELSPAELEEIKRQLMILEHHPDRFLAYLKDRCHNMVRTYWEEYVAGVGLNPDEIKKLAEGEDGDRALKQVSQDAAQLGVGGDFSVFVNNREFIQVKDKEEFGAIIKKLGLNRGPK